MNNSIILIAQNSNNDMFDNKNVQGFDSLSSEIPALPEIEPTDNKTYTTTQQPKYNNEKDVFIAKTLQMGLWLIACIVIILVAAFAYKKIKNSVVNKKYDYDISEYAQQNEQPTEYIQSPIRKSKLSKLNTPSSIRQCILSFLEITKEN